MALNPDRDDDVERWKRIEDLYGAALSCAPDERDAFLDRTLHRFGPAPRGRLAAPRERRGGTLSHLDAARDAHQGDVGRRAALARWTDARPLREPFADWIRGNGRHLPGARFPAGATGRTQGPSPPVHARSGIALALHPRGQSRVRPQSSEHHHRPRNRRRGGHPLHRHRADRRRFTSRAIGRRTPRPRRDTRRGDSVRGGARRRPPGGHRASGHQAREHHAASRRAGEGRRFRPGADGWRGVRRGRGGANASRRDHGHAAVHVAGAGTRAAARRADRHLQPRRGALRNGGGPASLRWRVDGRGVRLVAQRRGGLRRTGVRAPAERRQADPAEGPREGPRPAVSDDPCARTRSARSQAAPHPGPGSRTRRPLLAPGPVAVDAERGGLWRGRPRGGGLVRPAPDVIVAAAAAACSVDIRSRLRARAASLAGRDASGLHARTARIGARGRGAADWERAIGTAGRRTTGVQRRLVATRGQTGPAPEPGARTRRAETSSSSACHLARRARSPKSIRQGHSSISCQAPTWISLQTAGSSWRPTAGASIRSRTSS